MYIILILSFPCFFLLQDLIKEKGQCLEDNVAEINQLKASLRDRDQDIERANQMLLNTEDTIDVSRQ